MKGYKAFDSKLMCRDFQFKVGKTYEIEGQLKICSTGFHFCENLFDVYSYYPKESSTRICEIEALGETVKDGDKSATSKIKIVRELTVEEKLEAWIKRTNSGNRNSGYGNSGNKNSGYGNSGYGNSGNRNSGDWNSGDGNSGYFNTKIPLYFFNQPSKIEYTKELENKLRSLNVKPILTWVSESSMTEQEKNDHPKSKITGGFLRKTERHDWRYLSEQDKTFIQSLPNFDDEIFMKISNGVSLLDNVEVIVNGVTKKIKKYDARKLGLIE